MSQTRDPTPRQSRIGIRLPGKMVDAHESKRQTVENKHTKDEILRAVYR